MTTGSRRVRGEAGPGTTPAHVAVLVCAAVALAVGPAHAGTPQPAAVPAPPAVLAGHMAVYDLSLASSKGARSVISVRGRIAYDFGGDACEGYPLSFRQVSVVEPSEGESRLSDLRSTTFEEGDGSGFKFRQETQAGARAANLVDGHAERSGGDRTVIELSKPKRERQTVEGEVLFPSQHMKRLIEAARAGQSTFAVKVFDGSDDGRKVFDTLSIIGKRIAPGRSDGLEPAALKAGLDKIARWPVTITYFTPGEGERTPIYAISFDMFENGISGALKLDYGDFVVKGDMKTLDLKSASKTCQR
ncbi:cell envelope integrity EipB family protein [Chelatococcus reniformis]|uniref:DUF1849 domain-containing protein n=1 Tax=Chelatococcus reniformis TaxID=1494448 RepID=A0A916U274_9HYPH|nr:cell envelope integrity EipB family protein [Chelatococcus reniformis]GGC57362.1 hypothetical protein GCM10010994_15410 [Chelatococcus reniformis]